MLTFFIYNPFQSLLIESSKVEAGQKALIRPKDGAVHYHLLIQCNTTELLRCYTRYVTVDGIECWKGLKVYPCLCK